MYYKEMMIGGKLMFRTTPDGDWFECPIDKAWDKITELQDEITELRACIATASTMLNKYA